MNLAKTFLSVAWTACGAVAFVPSTLVSRHCLVIGLSKEQESEKLKHCIPLQEIGLDDLPKVGGKTASLGEMIQQLTPLGVAVPGGFGVSSTAYDAVLDRFQLRERLSLLLRDVDVNNLDDLASEYFLTIISWN